MPNLLLDQNTLRTKLDCCPKCGHKELFCERFFILTLMGKPWRHYIVLDQKTKLVCNAGCGQEFEFRGGWLVPVKEEKKGKLGE